MAEKLAPEKRHRFLHNGQTVFEWDQTLDEINIYINLPPNVHSKQFYCKIQSKHIELGIKGNPPYLNHELTCPVKTDSSFWTLEDDVMHITLTKRDKGQTWASPIMGQGQLDPYVTDQEQKRLMLQRFQEEPSVACLCLQLNAKTMTSTAISPSSLRKHRTFSIEA
ncbi:CS domain-containing protein [Citrus sinensis]|uniref:CS domain-containing protein n=1 Tax=Citrus sinensis TaxID=2711 RepID=A0ACB8IXD1_CITSI|nr:CS domain-containing protein [Citrus sinensis]